MRYAICEIVQQNNQTDQQKKIKRRKRIKGRRTSKTHLSIFPLNLCEEPTTGLLFIQF